MTVYSYYFKSESGDEILITTTKKYTSAIDFMKNEFAGEYKAWKDEGCKDEDISYSTFMIDSIDV